MKEKILNAYQPPGHFEEVGKLPPIVQGAADDKTELWLIRIPANEIGLADLLEKKINLNVDTQDGIIGHFYNSHVKKIACQMGFVKSLQAKPSNEDVGVSGHERTTSGITSEKEQGGALLDVEKPSKKKLQRSEASEEQ